MSDLLYLDTARLGRMSPSARLAHHAFADLAAAEGGSARFDRFLAAGLEALPPGARGRYPGLAGWRGLAGLKEALRGLAGLAPGLPVLVAGRSARLMAFAARLLFHPCRNVLVTDLGWPAYHDILEREALRAGRAVTRLPLRDGLLAGGVDEAEAAEIVRRGYEAGGCDGLFLTAVSHLGVKLPVGRIVAALEGRPPRFVVVDGAQGFCHAGDGPMAEHCDLYLAGCHKWLGAYHPMGLAFHGRRRSRGVIETLLDHMGRARELEDPLLEFSAAFERGVADAWSETVGLAPLFSCQGAVSDALAAGGAGRGLSGRLANADEAARAGEANGWRPLRPAAEMRTGILLLEAERGAVRALAPEVLRTRLCESGVAVTAYEGGVVRLSLPSDAWRAGQREALAAALRANA